MESGARKALTQGAILALIAFSIPFLRFVLTYLDIIAHELGHTLAAWGFGYPAVPAFDLQYGGGVTLFQSRSGGILLLVFCSFGYFLYQLSDLVRPRNLLLGVLLLYCMAAFTPIHELLRLAMGHAMELILAGVFLYRSMSGSAVQHAIERPLYAACGALILLNNIDLAWGLITDAGARADYGAAKGGGHWMDLSRIAHDYLGVGLPAVASALLLGCIATPFLSYGAYRHGSALVEFLSGES